MQELRGAVEAPKAVHICSPGKTWWLPLGSSFSQANWHRSGLSEQNGFLFCHRWIHQNQGISWEYHFLQPPNQQIHGGGPRWTSTFLAQPCCPRLGALGLTSQSSAPAGPCPPQGHSQRAGDTRGNWGNGSVRGLMWWTQSWGDVDIYPYHWFYDIPISYIKIYHMIHW